MIFNIFKNNKLSEHYAEKAWDFYVNYNYKKALNFYNKAIIYLKDDKDKLAEYFFYQAVINKNLGNLKIAGNLINKAIDIKDDNYNYYLERAEIKKLLNDENCENDLEKAYYLLKGFLSDEDYVEVLKVFSYSNTDIKYLYNYANTYLKINNPFKSIEVVNKFISYDNKKAFLYDIKTDILTKLSDYKNAIITISEGIKNAPDCGHYYIMRAGLNITIKNYKTAKIDADKALTCELSQDDKDVCKLYLIHLEENI